LLDEADLVIHALVISAKPQLNQDQTAIFSIYGVQPLRELFRGRRRRSGRRDSVYCKSSTEVSLEGRTVRLRFSQLEPSRVDEQLVLFLQRASGSGRYYLLNTCFGCFALRAAHLATLSGRSGALDSEFLGANLGNLPKRLRQRPLIAR
jgi:hypothetical protein